MANRSHPHSLFGNSPAHSTRLRIRMFAQMIRDAGVFAFGIGAGWMALTLTFSWNLAIIAAAGLGAFLVGYWLIPFYVEPDSDV
jgi:hypothetical protein